MLSQVAEVPVVNALDDYACAISFLETSLPLFPCCDAGLRRHPLQMLADLLTVLEYKAKKCGCRYLLQSM